MDDGALIDIGPRLHFHIGMHGQLTRLKGVFRRSQVRVVCFAPERYDTPFQPFSDPLCTVTLRFPQRARRIYSVFFPVLNPVPWIADMDNPALPFFGYCFSQDHLFPRLMQELRADSPFSRTLQYKLRLYDTPFCRAVAFWSRFQLEITRTLLKQCWIADSPEATRFMEKAVVLPPAMAVLTPGVEPRPVRRVIFIGRVYAEKGGPIVLETFRRLLRLHPGLECIYVGPIPPDAKQSSLPARIRHLPSISHRRCLEWLRACDILLLPTHAESFGFVLLEAMAAGCIPVTYHGPLQGAAAEIIDPQRTGILLPAPANGYDTETEAARFTAAILPLLDDPDGMRAMQENALAEIRKGKFSIHQRLEEQERLYSREFPADNGTTSPHPPPTMLYSALRFHWLMYRWRKRQGVPRRIYR